MRLRTGVVLLLSLAVLLPVGADLASLGRVLREWNAHLHRWGVRLGILHCELCEREAYSLDLRGGSIPILSSR